ncbi:BrnT family toxin [Desulfuromonas acetoxidans]|uniref:Phage-Barnase-EndoU-ColicinE5/D-RelE like nuclease 3 domain-containing protein n=1 Tax=Desulfuromonas acetoxidans (strain DSM 684 / 11070) TaxID=281689 RepID=Q1JWL1_DESA6|nr:BrnT family toxin [Desulfuromonas acetoxidans]EAT14668.1 hypothetical protein Dace_0632 [Desulfuromonas acetoxidans DSM 684]MBF0645038.1 BrnT family toxin [Desulfuromonas acetoxidans]NVD23152.1 BrnT family toxin [Desulfuromonas acetoxidans]NVE15607.1 BrnT family toxin [Desulfuromonas acetoxidans]
MSNFLWEEHDFRVIIGSTTIDFDPEKEEKNRKTHKYSLLSAVYFLERVILPVPQPPYISRVALSNKDEIRHEHMTVDSEGNVVFFVSTMREKETVRVISLRRASSEERKVFKYFTGFEEKKA